MSSNVELHSQSRRSSMTFGPIASKCFNISSQSKRAILNIFLTFVTFDQPEYRGMSTARFRVSPLGGWVRCQSNCRTASKVYERVILSSGPCQRSKKFRTEVHYQRRASLARSSASFTDSETSFYNQIQRYNGQRQVRNYNVIAYF